MSKESPRLGLATTRQLMEELEARLYLAGDETHAESIRVLRAELSAEQLSYSTWLSYQEFAKACGG